MPPSATGVMFGSSGIRGPVGETVSAELGVRLGGALVAWGADRVVIGRDPRPSGEYLIRAVTSGLQEAGARVINIGVASTPTIARAVGWKNADAGVAITASHNPPRDNGFKLWLPSGQAFRPSDQTAIERQLDQPEVASTWESVRPVETWSDAVERHVDALAGSIEGDISLSVIVDVGNGAGQVTAKALERLGCRVRTLNGQPDGTFPGRPSEPTAEHCRDLQAMVPAVDADLGIAHDGDADRMQAVDHRGKFLSGDSLLALFAMAAAGPGDRVAAPVDTSLAVDDTLEAVGASVVRTRVGDVHIADRASEADVVFGGEPSGAWIWPSHTLCPDGALAAVKLAEMINRRGPLVDLTEPIETYPIERTAIRVDNKPAVMGHVTETLRSEYGTVDTTDGIRVKLDAGWFLIRPSGTEPVIRITAEGRTADQAASLRETAETLISTSDEDS